MLSKIRKTLLVHFPCSLLVELGPNKNAFIQIKKPIFDCEKSYELISFINILFFFLFNNLRKIICIKASDEIKG